MKHLKKIFESTTQSNKSILEEIFADLSDDIPDFSIGEGRISHEYVENKILSTVEYFRIDVPISMSYMAPQLGHHPVDNFISNFGSSIDYLLKIKEGILRLKGMSDIYGVSSHYDETLSRLTIYLKFVKEKSI